MGTVGGIGLLTLSAGASTVQGPITKGMGRGCCYKRESRAESTMFGPINEAGEIAKLSGQTLGKIYD